MLIVLALLLFLGTGLYFYFNAPSQHPIETPNLPSQNAYPYLIALGAEVTLPEETIGSKDLQSLTQVVEENSKVFGRVTQALRMPSVVTTGHTQSLADQSMGDLEKLRRLGRLLRYRAEFLQASQKLSAAAHAQLEVVQFGDAISHGGPIFHHLVRITLHRPAFASLRSLSPMLPAEDLRLVVKTLESLNLKAEPLDRVLSNEERFFQNSSREQGFGINLRPMAKHGLKGTEERFAKNFLDLEAERRVLLTGMAIQQFEKENGKLPQNLEALNGAYLKEIPRDPHASYKSLQYQPVVRSVWSIGANQKDEEGNNDDIPWNLMRPN